MRLYLLALNPTDSVSQGFLPAALRMGADVTLLTDAPHLDAHRARCAALPAVEVLACDVRDVRDVIGRISGHHRPDAIFTNSDHLQSQGALAAAHFALSGKDAKATARAKNKARMRRRLAATGAETVWSAELAPEHDPEHLIELDPPFPCVLKPREGVAGEDVVLVADNRELVARHTEIRARRPGAAMVIEEYLPGELYTLETLGDGHEIRVLGGFHTHLSPPPYFIETRLDLVAEPPRAITAIVLERLRALGVGLGACHTEFVVADDIPRIVEVNYRAVGDQCDLLLADVLDIPLFEHILRTHLGERLPTDLGARTDRHARVDYPCADRAGTLVEAPQAGETVHADTVSTYHPLRAIGERHPRHHSNRDYLGVLRTIGDDRTAVDRTAHDFLDRHRWRIAP